MKYHVGDKVEVSLKKGTWFEGVIDAVDDEHYTVKLPKPLPLSTLHQVKFKRDLKTDKVLVKTHLETMGLGHKHLRLKDYRGPIDLPRPTK